MTLREERGSGGVLALALLAMLAVLTLAAVGVGAALAQRQRVIAAADAGALAAADTALGIHSGIPCEQAARVVDAHGATMVACEVEGVVATVSVSARVGGVLVTAEARAGPPR
ncbi:Rv3654c family TadE-like protein [Pseudolysinimonas sp.]|uniref:Rv3654c family TadE-like protein n=1 Tax=Pseudolysinimonas sp. TaxID=2680009 RepID=UPI00286CAAAA|nr:Rv3654c family TadE-like protein [Pseudolysinimonas sp.]